MGLLAKPGRLAGGWPVRAALRKQESARLSLGLTWLAIVTGLAGLATAGQITKLLDLTNQYPARLASLLFVLAGLALAVGLSYGVGRCWPRAWKYLLLLAGLAPVPVALLASDNLAAAGAAAGLLVPTIWLGRELAGRWLAPIEAAAAWAVGAAAALAGLTGLGCALGLLGLLGRGAIWGAAALALLVALSLGRRRLIGDLRSLWAWLRRPAAARLDQQVLAGVVLLFGWLNLIGALAPEIMSDAMGVRTPLAALFAATGRLAGGPDLPASATPGAGEVLNAVFLAVGPLQTAKLVSLVEGLLCTAGVAALGAALGGPRAGWAAALVFFSLPLVSWLSQTAYSDLLASLFSVVGMLLLVLRERSERRALAAASGCLLFGLSVKTSFLPIAAGLGVALLLAAPARRRLVLSLLAGLVAPVALIALRLELPLAEILDVASGGLSPAAFAEQLSDGLARQIQFYSGYGTEHSVGALLRSPFDVTFSTHLYKGFQDGFAGYALLALAPLVVLVRPGARLRSVAVVSLTAYVVWFGFAQDLRYGLPIFALFCAVAGYAFSRLPASGPVAQVVRSSLVVLIVLGVVGYLNTILIFPSEVPYRVIFGLQDKAAYLTEHVPAYTALRLLDAEPGATRAAVTSSGYAQLYTRVRLAPMLSASWAPSMPWSGDEPALLEYLDDHRISHIVVDRGSFWRKWEEMLGSSEEFLRRNTTLVGGGQNAYLYRILPPHQRGREQPWARGPELLPNGDFELVGPGGPLGWQPNGGAVYDASGQRSRSGRVAVESWPGASWFCSARVLAGREYLLRHATMSEGGSESEAEDPVNKPRARLQINWHAADGKLVGVSIEVVPVSPARYLERSMLATAPPEAVRAEVYAEAQVGDIWFDEFSLRAVSAE